MLSRLACSRGVCLELRVAGKCVIVAKRGDGAYYDRIRSKFLLEKLPFVTLLGDPNQRLMGSC